jgi:hypothetical protein
MKGCNTLTLCPAQMHEAVEFWLKNQVLRAEHAASVKVVDVRRKAEAGACYGFEIEMRETEASPIKYKHTIVTSDGVVGD